MQKINLKSVKIIVVGTVLMGLLLNFALAQKQAEPRFDFLVRSDFFSAFAGNKEALQRGMAKCEEKLKTEPNNADALVWHGAGLMFTAASLFQKGDFEKGTAMYQQGETEMTKAKELHPKDLSILVARAPFYVTYSRFVPNKEQKSEMLRKAMEDYEEAYRQQESKLATLSEHSRGELLFGLTEAYLRSGGTENRAKAEVLLQKLLNEKTYAEEADKWLKAAPESKETTFFHKCIGCHVQ